MKWSRGSEKNEEVITGCNNRIKGVGDDNNDISINYDEMLMVMVTVVMIITIEATKILL